jgi:negative regulator of flagellin synthesis FlgM
MTNPITQQASAAAAELNARQAESRAKARALGDEKSRADGKEAAPADEARRANDDVLTLSAAAQSAMAEPAFDRAKVDAIKDAIRDGNYPLNAKRIAENFVAIEQMIRE